MQPALFRTPEGTRADSWQLARSILSADEEQARYAASAGFDTVWVEDHMDWVDKAHLECLTTLAFLAARVPGPRYGTMVCGLAFRHPSYLAKASVNLDVLTNQRFILGIGAGNNADEHRAFGFPFPDAGQRIDAMAEAINVMRALWSGEPTNFSGNVWKIDGGRLAPSPEPAIPIMVGGGGEQKTLRVVAELADWWCADIGTVETFRHKSEVLDRHCDAVGRDPDEIIRSQVVWVSLGRDDKVVDQLSGLHLVRGTPDDVTREFEKFRAVGVEHFQVRFLDFPNRQGIESFAEEVMPRLR